MKSCCTFGTVAVIPWSLIHKRDSLPICVCGFHTWNNTHKEAELFYSIRKDAYKQKGHMTEALHAVLDFGFDALGLHRIQVLVADYNSFYKIVIALSFYKRRNYGRRLY